MHQKFTAASVSLVVSVALCIAQTQEKRPAQITKVDDAEKVANTVRIALPNDSRVKHGLGAGAPASATAFWAT